ncbi:unnamed protein product, partial [Adineta steineri]
LYLMNNPLHCTCDLFYLKYGDIYRLLSNNKNEIDNEQYANIDIYLNRWVSKLELRRHLEKAHERGDFYRFPIELSSFARCATPKKWHKYEINNITGIYKQCRHRWLAIEHDCQNYCQVQNHKEISLTTIRSISSRFIHCDYSSYSIINFSLLLIWFFYHR